VAFGKNPSGESKAILERGNIFLALEATGWKVAGETGAAQLLGVNSYTLASMMKALGIKRLR
jgi:transcriptional regulator with GAF, ATPase, and Fis domain